MASISYYFQLFIYIHYTISEIIRRNIWDRVKREGREIEEGKQFLFFFVIFLFYVNLMCPYVFSSFFFHYNINMAYQPLTTQGTKQKKSLRVVLIHYFLFLFYIFFSDVKLDYRYRGKKGTEGIKGWNGSIGTDEN